MSSQSHSFSVSTAVLSEVLFDFTWADDISLFRQRMMDQERGRSRVLSHLDQRGPTLILSANEERILSVINDWGSELAIDLIRSPCPNAQRLKRKTLTALAS